MNSIMIRDKLLEMLVCPEDRSPLTSAAPELLARLNQGITAGRIKNRAGQTVEQTLEGGLVRRDGKLLYPIIDDIPNMLLDEAISLEQLPVSE